MTKPILLLLLAAILVFTVVQIYALYRQRVDLSIKTDALNTQINDLKAENEKLKNDIEYYGVQRNAAKESTTQFNYHAPNEKLYILVPGASSTPH